MFQDNYQGFPVSFRGNTTGVLMVYDNSRSRWLSTVRNFLDFSISHTGLDADMYMRFGDVVTSINGYLVKRNATITCITARCGNVANVTFSVRKNGGSPAVSMSLVGEVYKISDNVNVDLDAGDWLQVLMQVDSGVVDYPIVSLEIAWRE
jgi:hypothetical protein